jgi:hypothetical protein
VARKRASLDYEVAPFAGAHKAEGVSDEAARSLEARGLLAPTEAAAPLPPAGDEAPPKPAGRQGAPASRPTSAGPAVGSGLSTPAGPAAAQGVTPATGRHQPDTKAKARGRGGGKPPGADDRIQRTVRLTPVVDKKLRELAEERGIDLNAAVSVAIAEDWSRCCAPPR